MKYYKFVCNCIYKGRPTPEKGVYYWEEVWSCNFHKHMYSGQKGKGSTPKFLKAKFIKSKTEVSMIILENS